MTRQTPRFRREETPHAEWCARDHRCNLAEHRSDEIVVELGRYGRAVLTRVRAENGREHAELRARVELSPHEHTARRQLAGVLADARALLTRAARVLHVHRQKELGR